MSDSLNQRRFRGPIKGVIFDWAGTIVDFGSRAPVAAVMNVFQQCGVEVSEAEARGPMGMAKRDHIRAVLDSPRVNEQWRLVHGSRPDESTVDEVYQRFLGAQRDVLVGMSAPIPGALETIARCRRDGLRIGSSTGYTAELMRPLAEAAASQGLTVDALLCADDVPEGRPAPWLCLENARRLGVYPMKSLVVVDDTCVGVEAGVNAGMWSVGVARSGNLVGLSEQQLAELAPEEQRQRVLSASEQLQRSGAHFVIDTVAELPAALQEISARLGAGTSP